MYISVVVRNPYKDTNSRQSNIFITKKHLKQTLFGSHLMTAIDHQTDLK